MLFYNTIIFSCTWIIYKVLGTATFVLASKIHCYKYLSLFFLYSFFFFFLRQEFEIHSNFNAYLILKSLLMLYNHNALFIKSFM